MIWKKYECKVSAKYKHSCILKHTHWVCVTVHAGLGYLNFNTDIIICGICVYFMVCQRGLQRNEKRKLVNWLEIRRARTPSMFWYFFFLVPSACFLPDIRSEILNRGRVQLVVSISPLSFTEWHSIFSGTCVYAVFTFSSHVKSL